MRAKLLVILCLTIVMVAMVACGGGYQAPKPAATTPQAEGAEGQLAVTATYPRFQPSTITLTKGRLLRLTVTATDTNHTFTVDELGINVAVGRGQTVTKEVKVEKAGTFKFYCTVPGHRGAGMEGTLRITE